MQKTCRAGSRPRPTVLCNDTVVLRAANQNLNDCRWQSYRNSGAHWLGMTLIIEANRVTISSRTQWRNENKPPEHALAGSPAAHALSAATGRQMQKPRRSPRFLQQEKRRGKMKKMVGSNFIETVRCLDWMLFA